MQNTTFGNKPKNGKLVRPYLESYVQVGANAVVVGDVHIGNYVKIGAGAVVTKSIPDNCVVVGNPARIISHKTPGRLVWRRWDRSWNKVK